jgi:hypothetical protein
MMNGELKSPEGADGLFGLSGLSGAMNKRDELAAGRWLEQLRPRSTGLGCYAKLHVCLLLECVDDAEEILGTRVPAWGQHAMQALAWFLERGREFFKADGCIDKIP